MVFSIVEVDSETLKEMKDWRRDRESQRPKADPEPTVVRSQLPTPSEGVGDAEPAWKLSWIHFDALAEEEMERRMEEMEADRLLVEEEEEYYRQEEAERARVEKLRRKEEAAIHALEEDEENDDETDREKEAFQEEVESLMRELRSEAQEHVLRAVEEDIHTLHTTSLKMRELEHQAREAEEMYMRGIEEQQEYEQDEVEERQQLLLLKRQEEEDRLQQESADAMRMERMQLRRKELKIRVQEEEHEEQLEGGMMVSLLENYVREEEAELWDLANLSVEESPERQHIVVWGGLRRAAEKKHEILTKELQERHDKFAENLREKILSLHMQAENLRRELIKRGEVDLREPNHLLDVARMIRDNFEVHIQMLDEEYRGIAERKDLWPPEDQKGLKHPLSAGAFRPKDVPELDRSIAPFNRPSTAPRRVKSARDKDRYMREGRQKAPTGFSFGIRAVFEALDPGRTGYITQESAEQAFPMLNLDISKEDLLAMCEGGTRVDFTKLEAMVLESIGEGTASKRPSRMHSPTSRLQTPMGEGGKSEEYVGSPGKGSPGKGRILQNKNLSLDSERGPFASFKLGKSSPFSAMGPGSPSLNGTAPASPFSTFQLGNASPFMNLASQGSKARQKHAT